MSALPWSQRVRQARAVLLDFDGTLAPNLDLPDLRRRVVDFTVARGIPDAVFAGRYIVEILDAGAAWLVERDSQAAEALLDDGHRLIRDFELAAARATRPFPETRAVLAALRRHGAALAVVTRNCRDAVLAVFPDLEDYCDSVLARDDVEHLKPDVRHLQQALTALAETAADGVMVGDGQLDMRIGRTLGMYCVGVESGSSDRERLLDAGADVVLPDITHFLHALPGPYPRISCP